MIGLKEFWHADSRNKKCTACERLLPLSEFSSYGYVTRQGKDSIRYESRCKACNRKRRMERYKDPVAGEKDRATSAAWKEKNRHHLQLYSMERQKDPGFRAIKAKAQRMRKARMRSGSDSKDPQIAAIYKKAIDLERKLFNCVECDDLLELKIHVDHKMPLKLGGKHVAENLQVISARENIEKGARPPSLAMTGNIHA